MTTTGAFGIITNSEHQVLLVLRKLHFGIYQAVG